MANRPWLRIIKVTLGPLEEWRGRRSGELVTWQSDGTLKGLRITGTFQKTIMGVPSPSQISLYNLARETRNGIKASLTKITVEAGWSNTELRKVFQGSVLNAYSERSGSDIITKIAALPGYGGLTRGVSSITFAPGTDVQEAAKRLAADIPGVAVNDDNFAGITGKIGDGGWSYAGSTRDGLNQLSEEYGFSWSINDGEFGAIADQFMMPDFIELNGQSGGLISISPSVTGPLQMETGVKIKALYLPGLTTGNSVKVVSDINPRLNGVYRIHTMNISIDAYSEAWTMDIESFKYM